MVDPNALGADSLELVKRWMGDGLVSDSPTNGLHAENHLSDALDFVVRNGAVSLAASWARGEESLPPLFSERLSELHLGLMGHVLRLERSLVEAVSLLNEEGIDYRIQKGLAVAHVVYDWPSIRASSDIDLLVRNNDFERAVDALVGAGAKPREKAELREGYALRFAKAVDLIDRHRISIDLHRRISVGHFGHAADMDQFFERPIPFELAGAEILAPNMEALFLNACLRATVAYSYQLSTLRDIAEIAAHPAFDPAQMREMAKRWKAEAAVARALERTEFWIPGTADRLGGESSWDISTRDAKRLDAFQGGGKPLSLMAQKTWAQPTWRDKAAFAWNYAKPDSSYLGAKGGWRGYLTLVRDKTVEFVRRTSQETRGRR